MVRRNLFPSIVAAASLFFAAVAPATAQGQGGQGRQGFGGFRGGMMGGGAMADGSRSAIMELLHRNDVRSELLLSARQREQLDTFEQDQQKAQQGMQQQMRGLFQGMRNATPEERQQKMEENRAQIEATRKTFDKNQEDQLAMILSAQQLKRLSELDLQWRGPLALSDQKVADSVGINADQKSKVDTIHQEYTQAMGAKMQAIFAEMRNGGAAGANGNPQDRQAMFTQIQKKMADLPKDPDVVKAKKAAETKIVAVLTSAQQQTWTTHQGKKFAFRLNDN